MIISTLCLLTITFRSLMFMHSLTPRTLDLFLLPQWAWSHSNEHHHVEKEWVPKRYREGLDHISFRGNRDKKGSVFMYLFVCFASGRQWCPRNKFGDIRNMPTEGFRTMSPSRKIPKRKKNKDTETRLFFFLAHIIWVFTVPYGFTSRAKPSFYIIWFHIYNYTTY